MELQTELLVVENRTFPYSTGCWPFGKRQGINPKVPIVLIQTGAFNCILVLLLILNLSGNPT